MELNFEKLIVLYGVMVTPCLGGEGHSFPFSLCSKSESCCPPAGRFYTNCLEVKCTLWGSGTLRL